MGMIRMPQYVSAGRLRVAPYNQKIAQTPSFPDNPAINAGLYW